MPVVHSSASALSTISVFFSHGPSSKVSTTSFSFRKSSSLKCSKPKPGPPVVSISRVRATPSAFGLLQAARAGCAGAAAAGAGAAAAGAGAAAGAAFWAADCDQASEGAQSATATNNPAATRILNFSQIRGSCAGPPRRQSHRSPEAHTSLAGPAAPTPRRPEEGAELSLNRFNSGNCALPNSQRPGDGRFYTGI